MTQTDLIFVAFGFVVALLLLACRRTPRPPELNWFLIHRHPRVSKKARGRGDVDHAGLSRRERAHTK